MTMCGIVDIDSISEIHSTEGERKKNTNKNSFQMHLIKQIYKRSYAKLTYFIFHSYSVCFHRIKSVLIPFFFHYLYFSIRIYYYFLKTLKKCAIVVHALSNIIWNEKRNFLHGNSLLENNFEFCVGFKKLKKNRNVPYKKKRQFPKYFEFHSTVSL